MSDVFVFAFQLGLDFYKCTFTTPRLGGYAAGGKKRPIAIKLFMVIRSMQGTTRANTF